MNPQNAAALVLPTVHFFRSTHLADAGHLAGVAKLYVAHADKLRAHAARLLGEGADVDAEDIVHDAFMVLLERPAMPTGKPASYLAKLVRRACGERRRQRRVEEDFAAAHAPPEEIDD